MASKDLNSVVLIGRLVRDPEIKYTASNRPVAKFAIANNDFFTSNNERKEVVSYFDIVVWGNHAVNCEKFLKRGSQVAIEGSLRQNRWTDQNGQNKSKVEINANSVQFLSPVGQAGSQQQAPGSYSQQGQGGGQYNQQPPAQQQPPIQQQNQPNQNSGVYQNPWNDDNNNAYIDPYATNDTDDDIPF